MCMYVYMYVEARGQHLTSSSLIPVGSSDPHVSVSSSGLTHSRRLAFNMNAEDPNSCPRICMASTLLTKPSTL